MIPFNKPGILGIEQHNLNKCFITSKFSGDGPFTKKCHSFLNEYFQKQSLLTTSCTDALEMAAVLANIGQGDEIIMPSFTFVSTANAFVLRGAKIVFVDIEPKTMNISLEAVKNAITNKTKAIVAVHYAGWSCDMVMLEQLCKDQNILLIEDAAQAIGSTFNGRRLGTFGQLSTFSFHETKNIHCGEGGALIINDPQYFSRAEIIREKGTNRSRFLRLTNTLGWILAQVISHLS
jgi:dTDP-4-amino-4,6-dideoxygalactose transaminase